MRYLLPAADVVASRSFENARFTAIGRTSLSLVFIAALLAGGAAAVRGQSALDGFDPKANGAVRVVLVQPDGKILIGGDFTKLSPNGGATVTRNRIARLNPDGTLDTGFNPNADNRVSSIAVQANGQIIAGGEFTTLAPNGGTAVTRNRIARLKPDGTLDLPFNPNANGPIVSIVVQAGDKILAGGGFTTFAPNGGPAVTRNRIARLNPNGTLDTLFNPNANGQVSSIAVQADGKILAGGAFTSIGGPLRNRIARLDATTGLADSSFDPNANNAVFSIAVQADGKILMGGAFTQLLKGEVPRNRIARLKPNGILDNPFNPNANGDVLSIAVQADGKVLASGVFSIIGGVPRNCIARLETDGRLDRTLNLNIDPNVNNQIFATAVQPDGKILIGGSFASVLGVARNCIARLHTDGTLDVGFNPNANGLVWSIAVQADGKIVAGGFFTTFAPNGGTPVTRNHIARLESNGALDLSFDANADNTVCSIAVQADGRILVGGGFTTFAPNGGQAVTRNHIARLKPDGTLDLPFNPNANISVNSIAIQADSKILAGGDFTTFAANGGQPVTRNRIARLKPDGTLDLPFNPNVNPNTNIPNSPSSVSPVAVQTDGKILVGGAFTTLAPNGGTATNRNHIVRLETDGTLDMGFDPNPKANVLSIAVQADGKVLAGGFFGFIGGRPQTGIARLYAPTGLADSFNPGSTGGVSGAGVESITVQADGKILAGGTFTIIGGPVRIYFARLSNDTSALQNLSVTKTLFAFKVTWTRGGSSPQFTRVTFEYSPDNVNYTSLGSGTAAGGTWTLTGLKFPSGQNFYIRARGYYRSGYGNGSESITESVRNAFIAKGITSDSPD